MPRPLTAKLLEEAAPLIIYEQRAEVYKGRGFKHSQLLDEDGPRELPLGR